MWEEVRWGICSYEKWCGVRWQAPTRVQECKERPNEEFKCLSGCFVGLFSWQAQQKPSADKTWFITVKKCCWMAGTRYQIKSCCCCRCCCVLFPLETKKEPSNSFQTAHPLWHSRYNTADLKKVYKMLQPDRNVLKIEKFSSQSACSWLSWIKLC